MRDFNAELRELDVLADLNWILEQFLQIRLAPSARRTRHELPLTLARVHEFVSSLNTDQFDVAVGKILAPRPVPQTTIELVSDLANSFCRDFNGLESDLLKKSLQEAFLFSVGVDSAATVPQFGRTFHEFIRSRGSKGLMQLVLGLHMFNSVWLDLLESDAILVRSEEALEHLSTVLEQACFAKAEAAIQMIAQHEDPPSGD
jgi:hypothetical protein